MYNKRLKIFVSIIGFFTLVVVLRLLQMQVFSDSYYRARIEQLKLQRGRCRYLKTIRGKILDRNGKVLAVDEPSFELCIHYSFASLLDERVQHKLRGERFKSRLDELREVVDKCAQFKGVEPEQIRERIRKINDFIWNRRSFQAWRVNFPDSELIDKYKSVIAVPLAEALAEFEQKVPDPFTRRKLINKVDIAEMHQSWPLLQLETDDDIFAAQLEFDFPGIEIRAEAKRVYPFGPTAAQTIGWVGKPQKQDMRLFADDKLARYLEDDFAGKEDGVEYVCEAILRGRRGEAVYDIDNQLVRRTPTHFGQDVRLTLDIELQQRVEQYITDCNLNPNCHAPTAAVVIDVNTAQIDVNTAQILVLASLPSFNANTIRYEYGKLVTDPNEPLRNRAINKQYPPGSVVKPLILIAGLESGKITPDEVISCPDQKAPRGWPNCWIFNRFKIGHDYKWSNNARNAIKGSCNVYFSRLADRIEPSVLQRWLFAFGYGHQILSPPAEVRRSKAARNFRQVPGQISSKPVSPNTEIKSVEQLPPINARERRYFGIGQGNLRVSCLQVANAMAAIARGGIYKPPVLFLPSPGSEKSTGNDPCAVDLNLAKTTLSTVLEGMGAVVNEIGGTAYTPFSHSGIDAEGVRVYGKTGSTEKPYNAWFGGFAVDNRGRSIAIAVVVEGGQHGSTDAAPLARDIIQFCIEAGYIGQPMSFNQAP